MSATTCARSGAGALYAAAHDSERGLYWALLEMQRDQDALAARGLTMRRVNQRAIGRAHRRRSAA